MALFALPPVQSAIAELIEPIAAPIIPISGLAAVERLPDGLICMVCYQLVPSLSGTGLERLVACRLIAPAPTLRIGMRLAETVLTQEIADVLRLAH